MKMMRIVATLSYLAFVSHSVALGQAPQVSKPVVDQWITNVTPAAQTLEERLKEIDAVLRVKVASSSTRVVPVSPVELAEVQQVKPNADLPPNVFTEYIVEVLEVVKAHRRAGVAGITVPLLQAGGEVDWRNVRLVVHSNAPRLVPGGSYLVFLDFSDKFDAMMISPFDIYRLDAERIESNRYSGATNYGASIVNKTPAAAIEAIRTAVDALQ